jgi:hypothetical protein
VLIESAAGGKTPAAALEWKESQPSRQAFIFAFSLQERAFRAGRGSPVPLTDQQERVLETMARQVFEEIDRLKGEI